MFFFPDPRIPVTVSGSAVLNVRAYGRERGTERKDVRED